MIYGGKNIPFQTGPSEIIHNFDEIIYPLFQIQRKYQYSGKSTSGGDVNDLQSAFELAERSCPGVSDLFVKEIIHKLVPGYSETRINTLMDKVMR